MNNDFLTEPATAPLLVCDNLKKTYHDGELQTQVLKGISFTLDAGEMVAIIGASGSGKSTLLHIIGALDDLSAGAVHINGRHLAQMHANEKAQLRNKQLGFVYQFHHLLADFSALENVAMPLLIGGAKPALARKKAAEMLAAVGVSHRLEHRPSALSGGERQRVAIARAVVNQPQLVLADEPTGNLDHHTAQAIYALMRQLNQEFKTSFLVVTHDNSLATKLDRQLVMRDGLFINQALGR